MLLYLDDLIMLSIAQRLEEEPQLHRDHNLLIPCHWNTELWTNLYNQLFRKATVLKNSKTDFLAVWELYEDKCLHCWLIETGCQKKWFNSCEMQVYFKYCVKHCNITSSIFPLTYTVLWNFVLDSEVAYRCSRWHNPEQGLLSVSFTRSCYVCVGIFLPP